MSRDLCVLHITDPHLLASRNGRLHGWHVQNAFDEVLNAAFARYPRPDALVLGGDLVDDESVAGYQRLDRQLAALEVPVLAVAGNHDSPAHMQRYLAHATVHGVITLEDWQLVGLNTHKHGHDSGELDAASLERLSTCIENDSRHTLAALHHPPWAIGSRWLDQIGLANADALTDMVTRAPGHVSLICGHAHQQAAHHIGKHCAWITPSTMRQFLPLADEFAEDTGHGPGYRQLTLHADGTAATMIHRLPTECQGLLTGDGRA